MAYSSFLKAFFIDWSLAMGSISSFLLPKENPTNLECFYSLLYYPISLFVFCLVISSSPLSPLYMSYH